MDISSGAHGVYHSSSVDASESVIDVTHEPEQDTLHQPGWCTGARPGITICYDHSARGPSYSSRTHGWIKDEADDGVQGIPLTCPKQSLAAATSRGKN
mmetsp:Transcript_47804/g.74600  ORF Transcript_47804/g.74600 Transcript_47804/m.74600 type:complete len:98 (+) Transcript_47804:1055-1348(+)